MAATILEGGAIGELDADTHLQLPIEHTSKANTIADRCNMIRRVEVVITSRKLTVYCMYFAMIIKVCV